MSLWKQILLDKLYTFLLLKIKPIIYGEKGQGASYRYKTKAEDSHRL